MNLPFRTLTSTFSSSSSLLSSSDPSPLPPPPMPPPAISSSSSSSSSSSPSTSSSSSGSFSSSSSFLSASLSASTSPLTPQTRFAWRVPPPPPRRRPLPQQWMHPTTTTPISTTSTTTTTTTLTPIFPAPSAPSSSTSSSPSVDRATPTPSPSSLTPSSSHDPLTSLRLSAFMNNDSSTSSATFEQPPRIRQRNPLQRLSFSAPCSPSPALSSQSRPLQLVFASGAIGTASGLGHVFGRPLQAKETIPCSPLNCTQWQKEPPQSLAQQAQSPSHTFQQQCAVHKRFRLFRQRPRRCQVHASSYHHGTTSGQGTKDKNGPNYILPPTTVYPLVVRPDKILLDHHEEPPVQESWWPTLTSISMSSRLSFSTVSLSLSTTNTTASSTASFQTHGSEDDESFLSTSGSYPSSKASKKLSKKEKQLQKQLQKQEQQRQQQQQQKLRCLCYLDTSLDNQLDIQQPQQPQKQQKNSSQQSKRSSKKSKDKDKEKDKEAAGRLRRIWNESVINFHWSKPPGSNGSRQSPSPSPSHSSSSGYHHTTVTGAAAGESLQHSNNLKADGGVSMRHSLSGTDISDEGNHTLSDIEDDLLDGDQFRHLRHGTTATPPTSNNSNYSHHRVSFQGPYGASSNKASSASGGSTSRPKDDLKAIARHQAELSLQQHQEDESLENKNNEDDDFRYSMSMDDDEDHDRVLASLPPPPPPVLSSFGSHIPETNEEDDEDEDWDIQSDSGAPSSSTLMYSADVREPSCRSTLALPMSANPAHNKAYLKKPSNANLSSLRSRQRCLSLPADTVPPKGGFLRMSSSTPSENWDEDFDISADIHVPTKVVENQMSLQMDLYNIKDFASQIEDLKSLRASLRMASSSLKATNPKKHQDLSMLFQRDWEQAEVIIDLGEIAQTSPTTTSPPGTSSALGSSGKKASEPSLASLSTGAGSSLSSKPSMGLKSRRPALATSAPANNQLTGLSAFQSIQQQQVRSDSQSSNLTGTTLVASVSGDTESDTSPSTRTSSRASSSASASAPLKVDIEGAFERLTISQQQASTSPQGTTGRNVGGGMRMRQVPSMAYMKESCSSPAGLGLCTSPMTSLRPSINNRNATSSNDEDYDDYDDDDLEIRYENASIGLLRFPEGEQPLHRGFHDKEDSSATVKPLSPRSPKEGGGIGSQADMEASSRRYQKYSHYSKRRTTGGLPNNSRRPIDEHYEQEFYDEEEEDEEEEDDGYESYGYGYGDGSSSIGVFTPIPSDRHMQVLKDILMEGLGTEVARQYMFKQGEQDHVRFSVEVIPGLLGHLKGLQQRLGDQLMELQSFTVIV